MAVNLVNLVKDQLGQEVMGQLSNIIGETPEKTQTALDGAVPAMLGSFLNLGSSTSGANNLLNSLTKLDDGLFNNFAGMLGKGQSSNLLNTGTSLLSNLLGAGDLGKLAGALSGFGGIGKSSASSLLGLLAPLLMGVLKRQVAGSGGLNANNLMSLLSGQKSAIAQAMPAGLSNQLGSAGLSGLASIFGGSADAVMDAGKQAAAKVGSTASSAADAAKSAAASAVKSGQAAVNSASQAAQRTASTGNSMVRWLIPLVVIALALWLLFNFLGNRGRNTISDAAQTAGQAAGAVAETAQNAAEAATDAAAAATEAVAETAQNAASAAGEAVSNAAEAATEAAEGAADAAAGTVAEVSEALQNAVVGDINIGQGLTDAFGSVTGILNGITDEASAQAALPQLSELNTKLEGMAGVLDQLPAEAREAVSNAALEGTTAMQSLLNKVNALPGVEGVIKQIVDTIMATLAKFTS